MATRAPSELKRQDISRWHCNWDFSLYDWDTLPWGNNETQPFPFTAGKGRVPSNNPTCNCQHSTVWAADSVSKERTQKNISGSWQHLQIPPWQDLARPFFSGTSQRPSRPVFALFERKWPVCSKVFNWRPLWWCIWSYWRYVAYEKLQQKDTFAI